ncbi:hypothetical protein [Colwellia sp. E2M01]|uniref:hypothetical protein n=1 Tax=Colwellia sp. E2M01 TaxID=2841561 RepID=UPI001C09AEAB|nr:hypothetical protein [Colwellia sp. E2M01]MBU2869177.1 hypothetical protein [Colwellia sp. E2M01]
MTTTKPSAKLTTQGVVNTETPFDKRHCCWFCGEPSHVNFIFPPQPATVSEQKTKYLLLSCSHLTISVPCCGECQKLAAKAQVNNIWAVKDFVKKQLLKIYAKHLAIGVNWSKEELSSSEFEGGNFESFAKSAWFVYEVAKGRVSYTGWPLVANGVVLDDSVCEEEQSEAIFHFDGVAYPTVSAAIEHYGDIFLLDRGYVSAVLQYMANGNITEKSFAQTIRFCRLLVNATPKERKMAFLTLINSDDKHTL